MAVMNDIEHYETRLKDAMLASDVAELDKLLASDLVFTNHLGQLMSKSDDLEAHRSGAVRIAEVEADDVEIKLLDGVAIVLAKVHIAGEFFGHQSTADFRFTRVWAKGAGDAWQLSVAHSTLIS